MIGRAIPKALDRLDKQAIYCERREAEDLSRPAVFDLD